MTLSYTELRQMLETAVVAARLGGQRAMEELRYVRRTVKNGRELVTQADPVCQKIIIDRIREAYPDHGFLAEEGPDGKPLKWTPRGDWPIWWVIDPIDGTNNYANRLLCFSVSIAVFYKGQPVVGVIFDPTTDSMFTAVRDDDAQLNTARIAVNEETIGKFSQFGIDSNIHPITDQGIRTLMSRCRIRCLGSTALHLAYVAGGALIGAVTHTARLWDIAAGILLIEQAGGQVTNLTGTALPSIDPETYDGQPYTILAANSKSHKELIALFAT